MLQLSTFHSAKKFLSIHALEMISTDSFILSCRHAVRFNLCVIAFLQDAESNGLTLCVCYLK